MQNFKVGDWVKSTKYSHLKPIQIESMYESNERKGEFGLKSGGIVLYSSEAVHWKPQEGEYIWSPSNNIEAFIFKWTKEHDKLQIDYKGIYEPFIGNLPTFLKDNT